MDERLERAKWLYTANAGSLTVEQCVKQAIQELGEPSMPKGSAQIFDITQKDYTEAYIQTTIQLIKDIFTGGKK